MLWRGQGKVPFTRATPQKERKKWNSTEGEESREEGQCGGREEKTRRQAHLFQRYRWRLALKVGKGVSKRTQLSGLARQKAFGKKLAKGRGEEGGTQAKEKKKPGGSHQIFSGTWRYENLAGAQTNISMLGEVLDKKNLNPFTRKRWIEGRQVSRSCRTMGAECDLLIHQRRERTQKFTVTTDPAGTSRDRRMNFHR